MTTTLKGQQQENLIQTHYKQLKQKPNAQLTGSTFDAKHLDKFLQTEYGEKGAYPIPISPIDPKVGLGAGKPVGETANVIPLQTNVRPDPCFLTVPRQMRKEVNHGVTAKPFEFVCTNMGLVGNNNQNSKELYQKQVKELERLKNGFDPKKLSLDQEAKGLIKPADRRKEIEEIKKNCEAYNEYKKNHMFAVKRDRVVKAGWKNGIAGVDSVLDPNTFFFKEQQAKMVDYEIAKIEMNQRNVDGIFIGE